MPETEGVGDGASLLYIGDWAGYDDQIFALGGGEADEDPGYNFYSYSLAQNQWGELEDISCPIGYYVGNRLGFADDHIYYWQGTPSTWECGGNAFYRFEISSPTLKVHNINTGEDFATIQAAIDDPDTTTGNVIEVEDGTFVENVDVYKSLTIRSENGSENCIVQAANSSDHVFEVTADNVNISGFYVSGANPGYPNYRAGIFLHNVDNSSVFNNYVISNDYGILSDGGNNNTIVNNSARYNYQDGIRLYHSTNSNVTDNLISRNNRGVSLEYSNNNTVLNNNASYNNGGISLWHSSNNMVSHNKASYNVYSGLQVVIWTGIGLGYSSNNNMVGDNIILKNNYGIKIESPWDVPSSNNIIRNNDITENSRGIWSTSLNSNLIYNNYFNNTHNAYDENGNNVWNITKTPGTNIIGGSWLGGNYWSDYTGVDNTGDGFGDTQLPYNSSGEIISGGDYHPLIENPCETYDTNGTSGIQVDEAVAAVNDYFDQLIDLDTVIAVIVCYFG